MSKVIAPQQSTVQRLWHKYRFHLNIVLVLIPLGFMPAYLQNAAMTRGTLGLGERQVGEFNVGPWTARLAEWHVGAPEAEGKAGNMKEFTVALCNSCLPQVKAAYLRIGKPRSLRTAGALLSGSPYRLMAEVVVPANTTVHSELWLTVEGWDGSVHQTAIALAQASPSLVTWLQGQPGARP
ncbi:hypothetical protein ACVW0Y_004378 [Pseudomonas sp. TE3786]